MALFVFRLAVFFWFSVLIAFLRRPSIDLGMAGADLMCTTRAVGKQERGDLGDAPVDSDLANPMQQERIGSY